MKTIKTYLKKVDADLAKSQLESAGINCFILGFDTGDAGYGGLGSIKLQVAEEDEADALAILKDE